MNSPKRTAQITRETKETRIQLTLSLDGGEIAVSTGIGMLDHMLSSFAFHGGFGLELTCEGDLQVDDHHTSEDCALALAEALRQALGDKAGIARFGSAYVPMDEALARAVVDLSGRPWPEVHLGLARERIGEWATENVVHFFRSLALEGRLNLHVDLLRGENDHHRIEAAFKAVALALSQAVQRRGTGARSVKGVLT